MQLHQLPDDWRFIYEERAAIMEHDGGLSREEAEARALEEVLRQFEEARQWLVLWKR